MQNLNPNYNQSFPASEVAPRPMCRSMSMSRIIPFDEEHKKDGNIWKCRGEIFDKETGGLQYLFQRRDVDAKKINRQNYPATEHSILNHFKTRIDKQKIKRNEYDSQEHSADIKYPPDLVELGYGIYEPITEKGQVWTCLLPDARTIQTRLRMIDHPDYQMKIISSEGIESDITFIKVYLGRQQNSL